MAVEILRLLSKFDTGNDRENETAFLRTQVPWIGPKAYLNVIFKSAPEDTLRELARNLRMPRSLIDFLRVQNGAILFSGALSVYGVHRPGQLLNREDPSFDLPFNIELENSNWPPANRTRYLVIGGYGFDGSGVCIDRTNFGIHVFQRGKRELLPTPSSAWPSLEEWLTSEIARLSMLFDNFGRRLVNESDTLPFKR